MHYTNKKPAKKKHRYRKQASEVPQLKIDRSEFNLKVREDPQQRKKGFFRKKSKSNMELIKQGGMERETPTIDIVIVKKKTNAEESSSLTDS